MAGVDGLVHRPTLLLKVVQKGLVGLLLDGFGIELILQSLEVVAERFDLLVVLDDGLRVLVGSVAGVFLDCGAQYAGSFHNGHSGFSFSIRSFLFIPRPPVGTCRQVRLP